LHRTESGVPQNADQTCPEPQITAPSRLPVHEELPGQLDRKIAVRANIPLLGAVRCRNDSAWLQDPMQFTRCRKGAFKMHEDHMLEGGIEGLVPKGHAVGSSNNEPNVP